MATKPKAKKVGINLKAGLQSGRDGSSGYPGYLNGSRKIDKIMSRSTKTVLGSDDPIVGKKTLVRSGEKSSKTYIESEKQKDGSQKYYDKANLRGIELEKLKKQRAKRKK